MSLSETISEQLKDAMKAKDAVRLRTLRSIRAEILKKEKEGGDKPNDEVVLQLVARLAKQRRESIEQFEKGGREDLVSAESAELEILLVFLPESLSDDEITSLLEEVLSETGATSMNDLGRVMGTVMKKLKETGKSFDGGAVNAMVKSKLGGG